MISTNFSNVDFTAVSKFVSATLENTLAPFSTIGIDVSSDVPAGSSVRIAKVGTAPSSSVFTGDYTVQDPAQTGTNVALTHLHTSVIIRDADLLNSNGQLTNYSQTLLTSAANKLATDVQSLFLTPLTGSANAAYSSSFSASAWSYDAVCSCSFVLGAANWTNDGLNNLLLHSALYRRVTADHVIAGNYALSQVAATGVIPNLQGFNLVEANTFPGTPLTAGSVAGLGIRRGGVGFVMRPIAIDPIGSNDGFVETSQIVTTDKGFVYVLKTWRRPEKGGRQWTLELQAGSAVADSKYVFRALTL